MTKQADIHRKAITIEIGRDLLNDGLETFLDRLVGPQNAARVLDAHPRVVQLERERDTLARRLETATVDAVRAHCTRATRCWPGNG